MKQKSAVSFQKMRSQMFHIIYQSYLQFRLCHFTSIITALHPARACASVIHFTSHTHLLKIKLTTIATDVNSKNVIIPRNIVLFILNNSSAASPPWLNRTRREACCCCCYIGSVFNTISTTTSIVCICWKNIYPPPSATTAAAATAANEEELTEFATTTI